MVKSEKSQISEFKQYISVHARQRFERRHGVLFTNVQAKSIIKDIIFKKAQFVAITNETQLWIVEYDRKKYRIVYSPKKQMIVTVYAGIRNKKKKPYRDKREKPSGKKKYRNNERRNERRNILND